MSSSPDGPVLTGTPPLIASSATPASKYISMQTRFRFGQLRSAHGQFNSPHGFCLGIDEDIVVADTNNHRIQVMMDDESDFNSVMLAAITKRWNLNETGTRRWSQPSTSNKWTVVPSAYIPLIIDVF